MNSYTKKSNMEIRSINQNIGFKPRTQIWNLRLKPKTKT